MAARPYPRSTRRRDTSPAQWRVIGAISADFFAGIGARAMSPHHLRGRRREAVDLQLPGRRSARLRHHARATRRRSPSSAPSCSAATCSIPSVPPRRSCSSSTRSSVARSRRDRGGGGPSRDRSWRPRTVELWPFLPKPEKAVEPPGTRRSTRSPRRPGTGPAARIAGRVRAWLEGWSRPGSDRPDPGRRRADPVQRRNEIFNAVIRALRGRACRSRAPTCCGSGRARGRDLLAALRVAATLTDDLSLAAFLRSPLGAASPRPSSSRSPIPGPAA